MKSRDDFQLLGNTIDPANINTECNPYGTNGSLTYAPCGAIANSLFNGFKFIFKKYKIFF